MYELNNMPDSAHPTSRELISSIRTSALIHQEMLLRVIAEGDEPSEDLINLLEDTGNAYITYSEQVARYFFQNHKLNKSR